MSFIVDTLLEAPEDLLVSTCQASPHSFTKQPPLTKFELIHFLGSSYPSLKHGKKQHTNISKSTLTHSHTHEPLRLPHGFSYTARHEGFRLVSVSRVRPTLHGVQPQLCLSCLGAPETGHRAELEWGPSPLLALLLPLFNPFYTQLFFLANLHAEKKFKTKKRQSGSHTTSQVNGSTHTNLQDSDRME